MNQYLSPANFQGSKSAIIYLRVSSEEQVENFSLGTQEEICRREALHRGFEIVDIFREEGKSAKTITGRPKLLEMLTYCRKNKNSVRAIFVYRLDRLSRQTSDYLYIRKKLSEINITIISATEPTGNSPTEKLVETVLAGFAQHDNDVRSERTRNGMRARFLAGMVSNHVPRGYVNQNGFAFKDPDTFEIYKRAWELMATGTKSLHEMSGIMKEWGLAVCKQSAQHMFRNKFYMGYLTSDKYPEEIKGQFTPMVTEEQFYKVQAILDGRDTNKLVMPRKSRDNQDFPLRRIVRCSKCGTPFTGAFSKGRHGKYGYYFCRNRCSHGSVKIDDLNRYLLALLKKVTPTQKGVTFYTSSLIKRYNQKMSVLQKSRRVADEEIKKLYAQRQLLIEKNLNGVYSDEIFKEQNALIEDKIVAARAAKNDALIDKYDIGAITEFIKEKIAHLAQTYAESDFSQARCLLGSIFMSGLTWDYPGCSNRKISPIYQEILDMSDSCVSIGSPNR